jgi:hydroxyethylthiazole kinase-like sugar kinase family protein
MNNGRDTSSFICSERHSGEDLFLSPVNSSVTTAKFRKNFDGDFITEQEQAIIKGGGFWEQKLFMVLAYEFSKGVDTESDIQLGIKRVKGAKDVEVSYSESDCITWQ